MAELVSWVPGAVSAAVSVAAGVVSVVAWLRARDERKEAGEQAKAAVAAATDTAGHLARIAEIQEQQHKAAADQQMVLERDPWEILPDPNHSAQAELYNDSDTPKFGVTVKITANGQDYLDPESFPFVGPRKRVRIAYIDLSAEMAATITWYLDEAGTVSPPLQIITW